MTPKDKATIKNERRKVGELVADPAQDRVVTQAMNALADGKSGMIVAPTGAGKSLIIALMINELLADGKKVIVIQPNEDLLRQNLIKIASATTTQKPTFGIITDKTKNKIGINEIGAVIPHETNKNVILCTQASFTELGKKYNETINDICNEARNTIIIIDEGEAAIAKRFSEVLEALRLEGALGVMLTATPFRTDLRNPTHPFTGREKPSDEDVIAEITVNETLAEGRIVPSKFVDEADAFRKDLGHVAAKMDDAFLAACGKRRENADAASDAADKIVADHPDGPAIFGNAVVESWKRIRAKKRNGPCLVHCRNVELAKATARAFGTAAEKPVVAIFTAADGGFIVENGMRRPIERSQLLDMARNRQIDVIVNCQAFGRGTDIPAIDSQILAFVKRNAREAMQNIGRGARAAPGKKDQLVVDLGRTTIELAMDSIAARKGPPWNELVGDARKGMIAAAARQIDQTLDADPEFMRHAERKWIRERLAESEGQRRLMVDRDLPAPNGNAVRTIPFAKGVVAIGKPSARDAQPEFGAVIDLRKAGLLAENAKDAFLVVALQAERRKTHANSAWLGTDKTWAKKLLAEFIAQPSKAVMDAWKTEGGGDEEDVRRIKADGLLTPEGKPPPQLVSAWIAAKEAFRTAVSNGLADAALGELVAERTRGNQTALVIANPAELPDEKLALALAWIASVKAKSERNDDPFRIIVAARLRPDEEKALSSRIRKLFPEKLKIDDVSIAFIDRRIEMGKPSAIAAIRKNVENGSIPVIDPRSEDFPEKSVAAFLAKAEKLAANAAAART
jgi:superfamily II DNA or RNA helicase